jgi:hypothetical protein
LEGAEAGRRTHHLTSQDVAVFFTDDPERAYRHYATPQGYVTRVEIPRWLADETYQINETSGLPEWKFNREWQMTYLMTENKHFQL